MRKILLTGASFLILSTGMAFAHNNPPPSPPGGGTTTTTTVVAVPIKNATSVGAGTNSSATGTPLL